MLTDGKGGSAAVTRHGSPRRVGAQGVAAQNGACGIAFQRAATLRRRLALLLKLRRDRITEHMEKRDWSFAPTGPDPHALALAELAWLALATAQLPHLGEDGLLFTLGVFEVGAPLDYVAAHEVP